MSTVLSNSEITINNGGRKLIKTDNSYLFAVVKTGTDNLIRRSKDNGTTWETIRTLYSTDSVNVALTFKGNELHAIYHTYQSGDEIFHTRVDGSKATISLSDFTDTKVDGDYFFDGSVYIVYIDGVSIDAAVNGDLHLAYSIRYSGENSKNIRHAKSTDNGANWTNIYPSYYNTTGTDLTRPSIKCKADNNPVIAYRTKISGVGDYIKWGTYVNGAWSFNNTLVNSVYEQEAPCLSRDSQGFIHLAFRGKDTTDQNVFNIRYAKATNTDATGFLSPEKLTSGDTNNNGEPTLSINNISDKIHIVWHGYDPAVSGTYTNIREMSKSTSGTWATPTTMTNNTTANAWYPHLSEQVDEYFLYIYKDDATGNQIYGTLLSNSIPTKPTTHTTANFDANDNAQVNWTFNDDDPNDYQTAYQLQILDGVTSEIIVDTGKVNASENGYTITAGTLVNGKLYQWKIKCWDSANAESPYSNANVFNTSQKPTATITIPANEGEIVQTANYTVEWDYSDPEGALQGYYQLKLRDDSNNTVWDSGKVESTTTSAAIGSSLKNDKTYTIELTLWDGANVASAPVTRSIAVQYTPPEPPILTFDIQDGRGAITCFIENPDPTGGQPTVTDFEVYRKILGTFDWERLAANEMVDRTTYFLGLSMIAEGDFAFTDYSPRHELIYEYKIRSLGDNGTYTDSIIRTASVKVSNAQLALTSNYEKWVQVAKGSARDKNYSVGRVLNEFSGRSSLMADFNEVDNTEVSLSFLVDEKEQLDTLIELLKSRDTLLYRDNHEAKEFVTIDNVAVRDNKAGYWEISVSATKVYFDEVV